MFESDKDEVTSMASAKISDMSFHLFTHKMITKSSVDEIKLVIIDL